MTKFFRFPHTPHLAWLGKGVPRDDKVLSSLEARDLLSHEVVVEEKIDGANLGFSIDEGGTLRAQNRGTYLSIEHSQPQFKPLARWLQSRKHRLAEALFPDLMLFGEWCYAVHSVHYTQLPDWFLAFDVYDRACGEFWSVARRDALVRELGLSPVPLLGASRFELVGLVDLLRQSQVTDGPAEGLYVRCEEAGRLVARAKLVRSEFVQSIDDHWSKRVLQTNTLAPGTGELRLWR